MGLMSLDTKLSVPIRVDFFERHPAMNFTRFFQAVQALGQLESRYSYQNAIRWSIEAEIQTVTGPKSA